MKSLWRKLTLPHALVLILVGLAYVLIFYAVDAPTFARGDPDRFFQIAVARIGAEESFPVRTLPQAEDIGWARKFPDKEFFFHVLTTVAYKLGGENAVTAVAPILGTCIFLSLALILFQWLPPWAALPPLLLALTNYEFIGRVVLLRPHVLSILLFVWIVFALLTQQRKSLFALAVVFALSYHAIYLPLIAAALYCVCFPRRISAQLLGLTAGGLLLGSILTPSFPDNLLMGWQHIKVALWSGLKVGTHLNFGNEAMPVHGNFYLRNFIAAFLALGFVAFRIASWSRATELPAKKHARTNRDTEEWEHYRAVVFIFLLATAFWFLALANRRATEYALPLSALAVGLGLVKWKTWPRRTLLAISAVVLLAQLPTLINQGVLQELEPPVLTRLSFEAIEKIPAEARGAKVFNTLWDMASYILYQRPDLRFIDLLDPMFLLMADKNKHEYRDMFVRGRIADPYALVREIFKSGYVLTRDRTVIEQLEADPNFWRLYPVLEPGGMVSMQAPFLFRVGEARVPNQVLKFEAALIQESFTGSLLAAHPDQAADWQPLSPAKPMPFTDLLAAIPSSVISGGGANLLKCNFVRPTREEIARQAGAEWLAVGGGEKIRVWLNGQPLLSSLEIAPAPRAVSTWIPLKKPLAASDRIEALACSGEDGLFLGFALSLWRRSEIKDLCRKKVPDVHNPELSTHGWPYTGAAPVHCLGTVAVPEEKSLML